jgi:hypothetical protein
MHQTPDMQTLELGAQGGRFHSLQAMPSPHFPMKKEKMRPPFVRFQFRETAKREQGLSNAERGKRS